MRDDLAGRDGRWGLQQNLARHWQSTTIWWGFHRLEDAQAQVLRLRQRGHVFRVYDRHPQQ